MTAIKNVIAINGSPQNRDQSTTYKMLAPFMQGMELAGAQTEIINLGELKIKQCTGCASCFFKTPAKCVIKDDAAMVHAKAAQADLVVFATPVYAYNMTGLLKSIEDYLMLSLGL